MENIYSPVLREKKTAERLAVATSTLWLYTRQGKLKSIRLSPKVTVWLQSDLDAFIQSRIEDIEK